MQVMLLSSWSIEPRSSVFYREEFGRILASVAHAIRDLQRRRGGGAGRLRGGARALAARGPPAQSARLARRDRAPQGDRRAAARGPLRGAAQRARTHARVEPRARAARARGRRHPRRAPAPDLHLLPSRARARGAGGARAAHALRPLDRRDRARLPGAARDARAAPGARQAQDRRRRHSLRGAAARAAARAPRGRDGGRLPRLQRGLLGDAAATRSCARISRRRRSASGACSPSSFPARPRRAACSR